MTNNFQTQVVLTFDRLPALLLSCYGNEWMETQNFDRLAGQSSVFEDHYAETPSSAGPDHPWWTGQFEFFNDRLPADNASSVSDHPHQTSKPMDVNALVKHMKDSGVVCSFVAEQSSELPTLHEAEFEIVEGSVGLEADHTDSHFAKLIARGIELLNDDRPQFIWLHSRGVPSPWLPTRVFAELYLDELEDADETGPDVARALLEGLADDDALREVLFGDDLLAGADLTDVDLTQADTDSSDAQNDDAEKSNTDRADQFGPFAEAVSRYLFAGYVSQLDHLLGRLLTKIESTESASDRNIGLIVTAASGQSFAERQAFVSTPEIRSLELTEQSLFTPLIVRSNGTATFGHRIRGILQPVDLLRIVREMVQPVDQSQGAENARNRDEAFGAMTRQHAVHFGSTGEIGIRDTQWSFVVRDRVELDSFDSAMVGLHDPIGLLFVKPDDQHDVNNVVNQEQDEAARLIEKLKQYLPARH